MPKPKWEEEVWATMTALGLNDDQKIMTIAIIRTQLEGVIKDIPAHIPVNMESLNGLELARKLSAEWLGESKN